MNRILLWEILVRLNIVGFILNSMAAGVALAQENYSGFFTYAIVALFNGLAADMTKRSIAKLKQKNNG